MLALVVSGHCDSDHDCTLPQQNERQDRDRDDDDEGNSAPSPDTGIVERLRRVVVPILYSTVYNVM
jgi:hypothetical protein